MLGLEGLGRSIAGCLGFGHAWAWSLSKKMIFRMLGAVFFLAGIWFGLSLCTPTHPPPTPASAMDIPNMVIRNPPPPPTPKKTPGNAGRTRVRPT